jgi:polyhydroxyalkanoate synthesis regulator protein
MSIKITIEIGEEQARKIEELFDKLLESFNQIKADESEIDARREKAQEECRK